ncbi:hypothetical protein FVEN_g1585 [Fusarium venenatum]|uniref:Bacteriophage T5 Orf172 DNA-binding domain-containing protein n=1 Tax=Fusarium venenatum TaxID=56646 RepID=A0A2L2ST69_9HYPO|nr:uncharacterized protein FVRRES_13192 [Fusarium venenatum]KAG8360845.1 hypothetical protein FVEN_g1585 [Fusarium venenatum]KAH6979752.1 hypothetical protein EDB82DRAFT_539438 [Fusarium venenatum]CEI40609.1 unnamed protein product [Fusarium venenatum]
MKPKDSPSDALSSLRKAIGLSDGDTIRCFAQAQDDKYCIGTLPNTRKKKNNTLLQTLALYELGSEGPYAAQTVETTLAELTQNLICRRPIISHAAKFEVDGKRYKDNLEYVYFLLTSKFANWQLERKAEELWNNRQHTPTRTSQKPMAKSKGYASNSKNVRCSDEDAYEDSEETDDESSEESGDEDVFDTTKREKLQGPKLVRESPHGERDLLVTPVRSRRTRNRRMVSRSTRAVEGYFEPPLSPSPSDDGFIVSPASVTSPDPSELFTPLSAVSTPDSLDSSVGIESRWSSFRTSYRKRQDASPTRRAELTNLDILSKDMTRKLNLSRSISDKEEDSDDESSSDTQGQNSGSSQKAATGPTPRQLITFHRKIQPVRDILECMAKSPGKTGFASGWIYGFTDPTIQGDHIKIGYTKYPVARRMREWERCGYKPLVKFEVSMPCAVKKMEKLIHYTLHIEEEYASCPATSCKKRHGEWFNISEGDAQGVVEIWGKFSNLMPYTETRQLNDIWKSIVTAQLAKPWSSGTKTWLKEELLTIVSKEAKLQDNLEKKKQERKEIKQQLLKIEEDEERLQRQLEGLAIGNR